MKHWKLAISGACAGCVVGIFGAGGGLILVPLLSSFVGVPQDKLFSTSLSIMLPIGFLTLLINAHSSGVNFMDCIPYLCGSVIGGILAGIIADRIPVLWLHRILGVFILWGGIRYLC